MKIWFFNMMIIDQRPLPKQALFTLTHESVGHQAYRGFVHELVVLIRSINRVLFGLY